MLSTYQHCRAQVKLVEELCDEDVRLEDAPLVVFFHYKSFLDPHGIP